MLRDQMQTQRIEPSFYRSNTNSPSEAPPSRWERHLRALAGSVMRLPKKAWTEIFRGWAESREWADYMAGLKGLRSMVRHSRSMENSSLALSVLSSDSYMVRAGHLNWYQVKIANNTSDCRWFKLIVDIYLEENAVHPEGHFGYFDKVIMARPGDSQDVQIGFDWNECAVFRIEGVDFPADGLCWGPCRTAGVYSVRAIAAEKPGQTLAQLEIHQKLSR